MNVRMTAALTVLLLADAAGAANEERWDRCWNISAAFGVRDLNDHPQGRLLEGFGLEGYHFTRVGGGKGRSGTWRGESVCDSADVKRSPSGPSLAPATGRLEVTLECEGSSTSAEICKATSTSRGLCGAAAGKAVEVVVVDGKWDRHATFQRVARTITLGCVVPAARSGAEDDTDSSGALAKCLQQWKYSPVEDPGRFEACIRMARADYCGDGLSFTQAKTMVDVIRPPPDPNANCYTPAPDAGPSCDNGACEEAEWNEKGAVCYWHPRYATFTRKALSPLVPKLHACLGTFKSLGHPGHYCRAGGGPSLIADRSKLEGNCACNKGQHWDGACEGADGGTPPACKK